MMKDRKTHCLRGHAYSEHAYLNRDGNYCCKKCARARMRHRAYGLEPPHGRVATHKRTFELVADLLLAGAGCTDISRQPELGLTRSQVAHYAEKMGDFLHVTKIKYFDFEPYRARLEQARRDLAMQDAYMEASELIAEHNCRLAGADRKARLAERRGRWSCGRVV